MKKITVNGFVFYFSLNATVLQICEYLYSVRYDLGFRPVFIETCDFDIEGTYLVIMTSHKKELRYEWEVEVINPIF